MSANQFDNKADFYAKSRPKYAPALLEFLRENEGVYKKDVADVGSGTGIFSEQLLELGNKILAVEPNLEMRLIAERNLGKNPSFCSIDANADNTTLPDASVDFVTVAQAFHWFEPQKFKTECQRILKPQGKVFLLWNNEQEKDVEQAKEFAKINQKYCAQNIKPKISSNLEETIAEFFVEFETFVFPNDILQSKESFIANNLSKSYALCEKDENYTQYVKELEDFFERWSKNGAFTVKNNSVLYSGVV